MTSNAIFVGIAIAKSDFVVACRPDGTSWTATNDPKGIAETVDRLSALAANPIVVEATGGYDPPLVAALAADGLPVVVANPRQVRDFAKATGQFIKPGRLDARLLALFAERMHPTPRPKILVGTHHKTGSVWMTNVFRKLSRRLGLDFQRVSSVSPVGPKGQWDIFFNSHSQFDLPGIGKFRGLHVMRDPRDVIVSSTFYHSSSAEPWLHIKRKKFSGMTYQEKINSFSSFDDKLLFEMENSGGVTLRRMGEWDMADARFWNAKYEDLIVDAELKEFEKIFESPDIKVGRSQRTGSTCAVSPAHLSSSNNHRLNTLRRLLAAAEQAPQPERGLRRRPSTEARKYCSGRSQKNP